MTNTDRLAQALRENAERLLAIRPAVRGVTDVANELEYMANKIVSLAKDAEPKCVNCSDVIPCGHSVCYECYRKKIAALASLAPAAVDGDKLSCGHHVSLAINSAESGQFLYCDLCDERSARRDAERMERELTAQVAALTAQCEGLRVLLREVKVGFGPSIANDADLDDRIDSAIAAGNAEGV